MPSPAPSRVLRVGVIQAGRIVEERHLRRPDQVTVGQDARNTFVIPNAHVPGSIPLFEHRGNQYNLLLSEGMQGRVRLDSTDVDFASLMQQGVAQKRGDLYVLALPETAKGKVSWGDVTLLFQLVQPANEERVEIPTSFRRPWWKAREPLFVATSPYRWCSIWGWRWLCISRPSRRRPSSRWKSSPIGSRGSSCRPSLPSRS